jgi:hypothetical protein
MAIKQGFAGGASVPRFPNLARADAKRVRCPSCGEVIFIDPQRERGLLCCQGYRAGHAVWEWDDKPPRDQFRKITPVHFDRILAGDDESDAPDADALQEEREDKLTRYLKEGRMTQAMFDALSALHMDRILAAREKIAEAYGGAPDFGVPATGDDPIDLVFGEKPMERAKREFEKMRREAKVEERTVGGDCELRPEERTKGV